jgi:hypothetical protein
MLKLTLSTDKVVVIRELTLGDQRSAAKNIGSTTNDAENADCIAARAFEAAFG